MYNMIQCKTDLGRNSTLWIVYHDGEEVFRGSRKRCFNFINRGNPSVDIPSPLPIVETPPSDMEVNVITNLRNLRRESRRLRGLINKENV